MLTKKIKKIKSIEDINIKIIDFGTSHSIKSKCNYNIGTYEYNPPEMILGLPYTNSIDIFRINTTTAKYKTTDDVV